jgi:hypothetical protein
MLDCMGSGNPAVVIEASVDWTGWHRVLARVVTITQICVYTRTGYGWSEAGPQPRTALHCAGDLQAILENTREMVR